MPSLLFDSYRSLAIFERNLMIVLKIRPQEDYPWCDKGINLKTLSQFYLYLRKPPLTSVTVHFDFLWYNIQMRSRNFPQAPCHQKVVRYGKGPKVNRPGHHRLCQNEFCLSTKWKFNNEIVGRCWRCWNFTFVLNLLLNYSMFCVVAMQEWNKVHFLRIEGSIYRGLITISIQ